MFELYVFTTQYIFYKDFFLMLPPQTSEWFQEMLCSHHSVQTPHCLCSNPKKKHLNLDINYFPHASKT